LTKLNDAKKNEIRELVLAQKKAKLSWVATICQVSEVELRIYADDLGLLIEDDFILHPIESKEQKVAELLKAKREQIVTEIVDKRMYRYDPSAKFQGPFKINRTYSEPDIVWSVLDILVDKLTPLRTVIHPFVGEKIDIQSSRERPFIEKLRGEVRQLPDEVLRLHISLKKYTELLVIPQIEKHLTKKQKIHLINMVTSEDNRMRIEAIQLAQNSIVEQKAKGKTVKEVTFRLPNGQLQIIPSNQIDHFFNYLKEIYHFEIRKNFYENPNFLSAYLSLLS